MPDEFDYIDAGSYSLDRSAPSSVRGEGANQGESVREGFLAEARRWGDEFDQQVLEVQTTLHELPEWYVRNRIMSNRHWYRDERGMVTHNLGCHIAALDGDNE